MFTLVKWFLIPVVVLAFAVVLALLGLFEDGWFFAGFALVSLLILIVWRCATFRLVRSYPKLLQGQTPDHQTMRRVLMLFSMSQGVSLAILVVTLLCLIVPSITSSPLRRDLVFVTIIWAMIAKGGVLDVLVHRALAYESPNNDLPQCP